MEEVLLAVSRFVGLVIDAMAVAIVGYGAVEAFIRLAWVGFALRASHGSRKQIWQRFGVWLLLGLEFELAADIIGTVVSPTWRDIGELAAVAVIRTFLNYFLEKDVERAQGAVRTPRVGDLEMGGQHSRP
jgi:uncharacterized membrane protein